jgi:hypothetical protein
VTPVTECSYFFGRKVFGKSGHPPWRGGKNAGAI